MPYNHLESAFENQNQTVKNIILKSLHMKVTVAMPFHLNTGI
jgi:hypothetical protein